MLDEWKFDELLAQLCVVGILKKKDNRYVFSENFQKLASRCFKEVYDSSRSERENCGKALTLALIEWRGRWKSDEEGVKDLVDAVNALELILKEAE